MIAYCAKYTRGPWERAGYYIRGPLDAGGLLVATVDGSGQEAAANGELIAAATELLEALQECAAALEAEIQARAMGELARRVERDMETVRRARAAIEKALGMPPNA